jgi:DNA helicase HerA-like ATPase
MTDGLYIGAAREGGARVFLDTDHLTTHAICLGMTGSGKTGLGIVTLEELARRGIPLLIIDLKGDMLNLLLNFPNLSPSEFEPWLPPDNRASEDATTAAAEQATLWKKGLNSSGLDGTDVAAVSQGVRWRVAGHPEPS